LVDIERAREIFERGRRGASPAPARIDAAPPARATPEPLPVDDRRLQIALTRVLVDPAVRRRFLADPEAEGLALGLDRTQARALVEAGPERIRTFAMEVASKRFSLLRKVTPGTYRLLEAAGRLHDVSHRFAEEHLPEEAPQFPNRTVRDGFWLLGLVDRMIAEGEACRHLADVARFERIELTLISTATLVQSARAFRRAVEAAPPSSPEAVLDARPRLGPHARVEQFACNVIDLVRRLMEKEPIDAVRAEPTLVLFSKAPGFRNVHHLAINERTRRLIELCDGARTTAEIAASLSPGAAGQEMDRRAAGSAEVVRRLVDLNAVTLGDPR
jgi:hypothetical protein